MALEIDADATCTTAGGYQARDFIDLMAQISDALVDGALRRKIAVLLIWSIQLLQYSALFCLEHGRLGKT
jgi:hypothetical protein